jgi:hypothetical protein
MRSVQTVIVAGLVLSGGAFAIVPPSACAQGYGSSGMLGGYGAAAGGSSLNMTDRGPLVIPYGGQFGGFMPGRMGGGSVLSIRSGPGAAMGSGRPTFRLSPLSGGMSSMDGRSVGGRPSIRATSPIGSAGGMGLGGMRRMPGPAGTSVMPPRIGYPFREPPSLLPSSASSAGMSM